MTTVTIVDSDGSITTRCDEEGDIYSALSECIFCHQRIIPGGSFALMQMAARLVIDLVECEIYPSEFIKEPEEAFIAAAEKYLSSQKPKEKK